MRLTDKYEMKRLVLSFLHKASEQNFNLVKLIRATIGFIEINLT